MKNGSFKLFKLFGITVYVHWSWFIIAALMIQWQEMFDSRFWYLLLYVALFAIVTLHEFGHALACLSVGGKANTIVLWPLGGIAFVQPPPRPGPVFWSIAAGPLVNLLLVPVTLVGLFAVAGFSAPGGYLQMGDPQKLAFFIAAINLTLFIFNMLPIYPLDGGQILQSILWFAVGRTLSLKIVSVFGLICSVPLALLMLATGNLVGILIAAFIAWQSWRGYRLAITMARYEEQMARQREMVQRLNPYDFMQDGRQVVATQYPATDQR